MFLHIWWIQERMRPQWNFERKTQEIFQIFSKKWRKYYSVIITVHLKSNFGLTWSITTTTRVLYEVLLLCIGTKQTSSFNDRIHEGIFLQFPISNSDFGLGGNMVSLIRKKKILIPLISYCIIVTTIPSWLLGLYQRLNRFLVGLIQKVVLYLSLHGFYGT